MSEVVISVQNLSKTYRVFDRPSARLVHGIFPKYTTGMREVSALKDVNFEILRGEAVGIIGRNGSGKSTLLEILTGTLTPTHGTAKVTGRVCALLELGSGFDPEYTGRENAILNGMLLGLAKDDILGRMAEILAFAEIGDAIDRPVKTYSSGMIMRLAFAVQVLSDPEILIIDEALSVGDFFFQQKCMTHIRALCAKGVTLLFVSHDLGSVRDLCNRAIYLRHGSREYDGEAREAIFRFMAEGGRKERAEANSSDVSTLQALEALGMSEALWRNPAVRKPSILAVFLQDERGRAATTFSIGNKAHILVAFLPDLARANHLTIAIQNQYGQLVTATGSLQLNNTPPQLGADDEFHIYDLELDMNLEAGDYSFEVTLGYETAVNQGALIHKTPQIGPITVHWDYQRDNAPFIGMFGLPAKGKFTTKKVAE